MNAETEDASARVLPETLPFWFSFSFGEATLGAEFEFSTIAAYDTYKKRLTCGKIFSSNTFEQSDYIFIVQDKTRCEKKKTRKSKKTDLITLCLNLDRKLFLVKTLQETTIQH
jgi:hypothetical protein